MQLKTWNVRTLLDSYGSSDRPHRRTALVAAKLSRYNIDIAALSETRILDEGSLTEQGMGYTFFWKGYPSEGQHLHGVGLAIKNTLLPRLAETPVGISERLMTLRIPLVKNRFATLLSAYAPTLPSESVAKDSFYQSLDEALRRIPKNDKIFLLGDFNARVGQNSSIWSGVLGRHGVGQVNANGLRLLTLCSEHNLTITNTIFQQKAKYKTSWMHPRSKQWHLIDYVIVRQSDIRDVHITRAMRGAECWTDHRLIMAKVHMQKLGGMELSLSSSENTMDQKWKSISSALYEAPAQTIGYKSKNHKDWFDENSETIHDLLKDMHRAHRATLKSPSSSSTRQQWQIICREVQRATRVMQNEWWTKKAHKTQSFADKNDMHNFYNVVKKIYGPISRCITPLKTADGLTVLKDQHSILLRWAEHFGTLLNQDSDADPTVLDDLPTLPPMHNIDQPPTLLEVLSAIRSLKNNKSPGNDNIPAELLKQVGYLCTRALHKYITKVWADENVPQQWKDANVVAIYKNKGDKAVCGNSRGISLLAVLAKVMLHRLIRNTTESILPESQCGFRKSRSTVDMIFTARQLQEKCREQHQDLFMAFVDLSKAFDTVQRERLWEVLIRFGCPKKFVNILRQFHDCSVTIGGQESSPFPVHTGVRQGCVLAPVLFNIFLLCVTQLLHKEIEDSSGVAVDFRLDGNLFNIRRLQATTKLQRERVIELQYADDCALVSHSPQDLQSVLTAVVRAYSRMGLTVNTIKTEVVCQWNANIPSTPPTFTAAGEQLSVVPSFRYLGSILSEDNTIDNEVQNRIKQASAAFGRLRRRVFQNKNLHLHTKVCVYQAICITTLLYSCEAWVTYSHHIRVLEQFHIRCLQRILGITWRDRVPHSEVLSKTSCRSIEATITQHQLRWLGHVVRMPSNRLPRRVLYGQLHHGRRSAGGQKKRYKDQLKTALKKCKIRPEALEDAAADRNTWRQLCRDGTQMLEEERTAIRQERRLRRNTPTVAVATATTYTCRTCNRICGSRIGLFSHQRTHR
ncbi:LOW QUALITY PROTEIN: uncharacterized protein LOC117545945 [Gymnodraco acuticeps]|uniref:LOW QUALITY PROTEIN: uncharacterized protein LOC117545945 n=1 Tax=Gymnodraco acuticeps TaxID=8218 RepID=A0A6P8U4Y6_GYMAC|nr:LOW QUALITY PROTEIN: uncharacterized protein LOC117545945 [Gymnodraco acuticeps]